MPRKAVSKKIIKCFEKNDDDVWQEVAVIDTKFDDGKSSKTTKVTPLDKGMAPVIYKIALEDDGTPEQYATLIHDFEKGKKLEEEQFVAELDSEALDAMRNLFTAFDTDTSSFLDTKELFNVIAKLANIDKDKCPEELVKLVMATADSNQDGKLSFEEFANVFPEVDMLCEVLEVARDEAEEKKSHHKPIMTTEPKEDLVQQAKDDDENILTVEAAPEPVVDTKEASTKEASTKEASTKEASTKEEAVQEAVQEPVQEAVQEVVQEAVQEVVPEKKAGGLDKKAVMALVSKLKVQLATEQPENPWKAIMDALDAV